MKNRLQPGRMEGLVRKAGTLCGPPSHVHAQVAMRTTFETLQRKLTQDRLRTVENLQHATHVKWAADEASSLAWTTGYPLLFFPSLFEEKSELALHRARRQDEIHARSRDLLGMTMGQL